MPFETKYPPWLTIKLDLVSWGCGEGQGLSADFALKEQNWCKEHNL